MHTGRKGRYTARISLLMKRSDLGRVRFEAVLRSVHRFVGLVLSGYSSDYAAPGEGTCWEGMTRSTQTDEVSQLHALLARLARRDPPHWVEWERRLAALSDPNVWNAAAVARDAAKAKGDGRVAQEGKRQRVGGGGA